MEVAAGLIVAEQVVSTTIEGGVVAGVALAQPTNGLKATLDRIASIPDTSSPDSLRRHHHTLTVVGGRAYIFGGKVANGGLAGNEMHIIRLPGSAQSEGPEYKCVPAIPSSEDGNVPQSRFRHAAGAMADGNVVVYGGAQGEGIPFEEHAAIWTFDTKTLQWTEHRPEDNPRPPSHDHRAVVHGTNLIVYGVPPDRDEAEAWVFNVPTRIWSQLPSPKTAITIMPPDFTLSRDKLYLLTGMSNEASELHTLDLAATEPAWHSMVFPMNPLVPGPGPRHGAGLLPISTGYGREFLLYFFGSKQTGDSEDANQCWDDLWTFQLPSAGGSLAKLKDLARQTLGTDTGAASWAEVEVKPHDVERTMDGKSHPGPLASFAYSDVNSKSVIFWGGINAKGETVGEGWIIQFG